MAAPTLQLSLEMAAPTLHLSLEMAAQASMRKGGGAVEPFEASRVAKRETERG